MQLSARAIRELVERATDVLVVQVHELSGIKHLKVPLEDERSLLLCARGKVAVMFLEEPIARLCER